MNVSHPKDPTKHNTNKSKAYRASNVLMAQIQADIRRMLNDLASNSDICRHIQSTYNKSYTQTRVYIARALKEHQETTNSNLEDIRSQVQLHLLAQYNAMLALHTSTQNVKYIALAQGYLDRYLKLFPNELQPQEDRPGTIHVTFDKIGENNE